MIEFYRTVVNNYSIPGVLINDRIDLLFDLKKHSRTYPMKKIYFMSYLYGV